MKAIAPTLRGEGHDGSSDGTSGGTPLVIGLVGGGHERIGRRCDHRPEREESQSRRGEGGAYVIAPVSLAQVTNVDNRQQPTPGANAYALHESGGAAIIDIDGLGVRMLTPRECERIMDWPDDWTRWGVSEKGVTYELKDSPRYQLCGNGQARAWGEWIYTRLALLHAGETP